jgi:hypothetical protein
MIENRAFAPKSNIAFGAPGIRSDESDARIA